jgi:hypothetical protein
MDFSLDAAAHEFMIPIPCDVLMVSQLSAILARGLRMPPVPRPAAIFYFLNLKRFLMSLFKSALFPSCQTFSFQLSLYLRMYSISKSGSCRIPFYLTSNCSIPVNTYYLRPNLPACLSCSLDPYLLILSARQKRNIPLGTRDANAPFSILSHMLGSCI